MNSKSPKIKVTKRIDREILDIAVSENCATIDGSELLRRFIEFRRAYLALEKTMRTLGVLKSE